MMTIDSDIVMRLHFEPMAYSVMKVSYSKEKNYLFTFFIIKVP